MARPALYLMAKTGWRETARSTVLALLVGAFLTGAAGAQRAPLDCTGPFARDADERALVDSFGAANVRRADIDVGEAMTEPGNVVFADDAARRMEILWHDAAERRRPALIRFRVPSAWQIALAHPAGATVALGATLADVEGLNGAPFALSGFGWDLGGYASGWQKGRMQPLGGCFLSLRFDEGREAPPDALETVNGDKQFDSSDPAMRRARPTVNEMSLGWPE